MTSASAMATSIWPLDPRLALGIERSWVEAARVDEGEAPPVQGDVGVVAIAGHARLVVRTMAMRFPTRRFHSVLLPTLGRPTMATMPLAGGSIGASGIRPSSASRSSSTSRTRFTEPHFGQHTLRPRLSCSRSRAHVRFRVNSRLRFVATLRVALSRRRRDHFRHSLASTVRSRTVSELVRVAACRLVPSLA